MATAVVAREVSVLDMAPKQTEKTDLVALAELREARFLRRQAKYLADDRIDPRLRAIYLDRTILDTQEQAENLGYTSTQRVSQLRGPRKRPRKGMKRPHPSIYPDKDTVVRVLAGAGVEDPGIERGRLEEWAVKSGRKVFNPVTGETEKSSTVRRRGKPRRDPAGRKPVRRVPKKN